MYNIAESVTASFYMLIYMYAACIAVSDVMEHQVKTWSGQKVQVLGPDSYQLFLYVFLYSGTSVERIPLCYRL